MMPAVDGFEVMRRLGEIVTPDDCLPILVLTADVNIETRAPGAGRRARRIF